MIKGGYNMKKKYITPEITCIETRSQSMLCASVEQVSYDSTQSIDEEEEIW